MLRLTKRSDYGLIALLHLTMDPKRQPATSKEIAEAHHMPLPLLSKVLQQLARRGFLASEQGTKGGYRLARDPRTISALEVIRAIDGPVLLTSCFHRDSECGQLNTCTVKAPLQRVHEGILRLLEGISIHEMASSETGPEFVWPIQASGGYQPAGRIED